MYKIDSMQKAGEDLWSESNKVDYEMPQISNDKPGKSQLLSKEKTIDTGLQMTRWWHYHTQTLKQLL